jgi:hypothetical protein
MDNLAGLRMQLSLSIPTREVVGPVWDFLWYSPNCVADPSPCRHKDVGPRMTIKALPKHTSA